MNSIVFALKVASYNTQALRAGMAVLMLAVVAAGCDMPERPPLGPPKKSKVAQDLAEAQADTVEAPSEPFQDDWESWYAYYLNNGQVGYSHIEAKLLMDQSTRGSEADVQYTVEDQVTFRRANSTFVQHLVQSSIETQVGQLKSFESELQIGPIATRFIGDVVDQNLNVETWRGTARTRDQFKWNSSYRGLVAVEQSLRRKPMTGGERRTLQMLLPIQHKVASVELICSGVASVPMLDGGYQTLVEIVSHEKLDGKNLSEQLIWTNEQGIVQKTLRPAIGLAAYRADQATAQTKIVPSSRVIASTALDAKGNLERPDEAKQVGYIVTPNAQVANAGGKINIPTGPGQFVRKMPNGTNHVFVSPNAADGPEGFESFVLEPVPEDSVANAFIDSNAAEVRRLAAAAVAKNTTDREIVDDLLRATGQVLTKRDLSQGFTKASVIARNAVGDCTEYSILFAALLRSRGIPARLAAGFVYRPGETEDRPRMVYHVWTIAHVDGQWLPLDPVLGTVAPPDRIALITTNLSGGNEYNAIAPVIAALGRIDIEIKAATY